MGLNENTDPVITRTTEREKVRDLLVAGSNVIQDTGHPRHDVDNQPVPYTPTPADAASGVSPDVIGTAIGLNGFSSMG